MGQGENGEEREKKEIQTGRMEGGGGGEIQTDTGQVQFCVPIKKRGGIKKKERKKKKKNVMRRKEGMGQE